MSNVLKIAFLSTLFVLFLPSNSMQQQSSQQSALGNFSALQAIASMSVLAIGLGVHYSCKQKALSTKELRKAVVENDLKAAKSAIGKGADINAIIKQPYAFCSSEGSSLLDMAIAPESHTELAELLIKNKAHVTLSNMGSAIMHYEYTGNCRLIQSILDNGYDINKKMSHSSSPSSFTALSCAISQNCPKAALYLLDKGADSTIKFGLGMTLLELCRDVQLGHPHKAEMSFFIERVQKKHKEMVAKIMFDFCELDEHGLGEDIAKYAFSDFKN